MVLSRRRFLTLASASASGVSLAPPLLKNLPNRAISNQSANLNILFISLDRKEKFFRLKAEINSSQVSYLVSEEAVQIIHELEALYRLINRYNLSNQTSQTIPLIKKLGSHILSPIDSLIAASEQICFLIDKNYLRFPLDILPYQGTPLFLQKTVYYSFSKLVLPTFNFSDKLSALIISDPTADPDKGAYFLKEILSFAEYYEIQDINLEALKSMPSTDLILISAHGAISFDQQDHLILGKEKIYPFHLARLNPKLVYLDSCQLGVSHEFIQSLIKTNTNYYIAPIISNEAGNSSTLTIKFFFKYLKAGLSPELALFDTRRDLYNYFKKLDNWERLIWRAFPFRVYQLN